MHKRIAAVYYYQGVNLAKSKETLFILSPEWRIAQQDRFLIVSGGADALYKIELENDAQSFFATMRHKSPFTQSMLKQPDNRIFEELVTAEVIVPVLQKHDPLKVSIIGDTHKLPLTVNEDVRTADLLLIVRVNSTYAKLLENIGYQSIKKPHLFVDMAFHHTLSLGPLVFPGETACIACLQGRITTRWGDENPPLSPRVMNSYLDMASGLIAVELDRIAQDDTSLTNKTVCWNIQDRVTKINQLLKVPLCPICTHNKIDDSGALALPWGKDESITDAV